MGYKKEELEKMLSTKEMSGEMLETLLEARKNGEIDFHLVDIREVFEYNQSSIVGTDLLIPTSMIQAHLDKLEAIKDEPIVLYCRTGNRTGQVMYALDNMGYPKVVHLSHGIIAYHGETVSGAELPNEL
jgi:rhodanese-related sulfurtransferase